MLSDNLDSSRKNVFAKQHGIVAVPPGRWREDSLMVQKMRNLSDILDPRILAATLLKCEPAIPSHVDAKRG